jgi:predicted Zn-dependent protease
VALADEERDMWRLAAEVQAGLDASGRIVLDASLESYLAEVARRIEPPQVFEAIPFRFRVLRAMEPNAFCLPNGAVYLHTGMLARMESEAELAVILGHEMTHAVNRHMLRHLRSSENTGTLFAVIGSLVGAGAGSGGLLRIAAVSGYHRDLEREADREAVARMADAGYDVAEAPRLFERLRDWAAAEKVKDVSAFYASHPRVQERIDSMRELVNARGGGHGGVRSAETYGQRTAAALLEDARMELASGRLGVAHAELDRYLAFRDGDAVGHLVAAEAWRRDPAAGSADAARAAYRRALDLDPRLAEAWRGLGLLLRRAGDDGAARTALARYLELAPQAPDGDHVRAYLNVPPGGKP